MILCAGDYFEEWLPTIVVRDADRVKPVYVLTVAIHRQQGHFTFTRPALDLAAHLNMLQVTGWMRYSGDYLKNDKEAARAICAYARKEPVDEMQPGGECKWFRYLYHPSAAAHAQMLCWGYQVDHARGTRLH